GAGGGEGVVGREAGRAARDRATAGHALAGRAAGVRSEERRVGEGRRCAGGERGRVADQGRSTERERRRRAGLRGGRGRVLAHAQLLVGGAEGGGGAVVVGVAEVDGLPVVGAGGGEGVVGREAGRAARDRATAGHALAGRAAGV